MKVKKNYSLKKLNTLKYIYVVKISFLVINYNKKYNF